MAGTQANPIWDFALDFYRRRGVSDTCIALQDDLGIDVNMLLLLMWMAMQERCLTPTEIKTLSDKSHGWQRSVIVPIRDVRRLLKHNAPLVDAETAAAYRKKVQALELEGEQHQLNAMGALIQGLRTASPISPEQAAHDNLAAFEQVVAQKFPLAAIDTLIRALNEVTDGQ